MKIERVTQFNFLVIVLSLNLKWNKHTDHISKKISRAIGVMYRLKQIYPLAVLLTLYQAIIYPHFIYGLLVWGSKIENAHPLHLLQKKALRIVANQDYIAHSEPICKALNLVKVPDMYTCAVWNFYYKLMNNLLPIYFENCKPTLPRIDQLYNIRKPVDICGVEVKRRLCDLNVKSSSPALVTRHIRCVLLVNSPNKLNLLSWLLIYLCNK